MTSIPNLPFAGRVLHETQQLGVQTRAVRHGRWFPLAIFGLVALGAAPFFWQSRSINCPRGCAAISSGSTFGRLLGPQPGGGFGVTIYWLITVPMGFFLTVYYYRLRAEKTGVQGRIWPVLTTGIGLLIFLVITSRGTMEWLHLRLPLWLRIVLLGDIGRRGLMPLVTIAVAVAVLARLEHSRSLLAFAGAFFALSLLANLYDMENLLARFGWFVGGHASQLPNIVIPALGLLIGAVCFALADRRVLAKRTHGDD